MSEEYLEKIRTGSFFGEEPLYEPSKEERKKMMRQPLRYYEISFENGRMVLTDWNGIEVVRLERGEAEKLADYIHAVL